MLREMLRAKIHRLTVTEANSDYEGSITIDSALLKEAGIAEFERVQVGDINNAARFETYAISGPAGSGVVCVNGAAAKLVSVGDIIIVMCYALFEEKEMVGFTPKIVFVDSRNHQVK